MKGKKRSLDRIREDAQVNAQYPIRIGNMNLYITFMYWFLGMTVLGLLLTGFQGLLFVSSFSALIILIVFSKGVGNVKKNEVVGIENRITNTPLRNHTQGRYLSFPLLYRVTKKMNMKPVQKTVQIRNVGLKPESTGRQNVVDLSVKFELMLVDALSYQYWSQGHALETIRQSIIEATRRYAALNFSHAHNLKVAYQEEFLLFLRSDPKFALTLYNLGFYLVDAVITGAKQK